MKERATDSNMEFRTAAEATEWITGLVPTIGIRPGLERMELLLEKIGHPERRLKFIHVAGTNGKGSVCAMLTSVLLKCGYDVGTFTSPYITSYANRFQYNGQDMPDEDLVRLANRLKPLSDELSASEWGPLTMFELTTALALLYYGTVAYPDYVVWETGMGGRLDVTNVVNPVVSVITNVGHDHLDLLGPELTDVAREKAGIIKPGVPVVSAASQPDVVGVLREVAAEKRSTLYLLGENFRYEPLSFAENGQSFSFAGPFRQMDSLEISLNGPHQLANAAVAVMTLEALRQYNALLLEDEHLTEGLREASWPGRLEMVSRKPRLLLDGAHNPEGMEALANALRTVYRFDKLNVMLAMMPNKNHEHSLRHILPMVDTLVITEPDFHKKMNAADLAEIVNRLRPEVGGPKNVVVEPNYRLALETFQRLAEDSEGLGEALNVVTGTLYLIADVRSFLLNGTKSDKGW